MEHRHLNTKEWSAAAIDSALEYGSLPEWRELFSAAHENREVAALVLEVAAHREQDGASILAQALVRRLCPDLAESVLPSAAARNPS